MDTASTRSPAGTALAMVSFKASSRRPGRTTVQPSFRNASETDLPIPEPAPAMMAILFLASLPPQLLMIDSPQILQSELPSIRYTTNGDLASFPTATCSCRRFGSAMIDATVMLFDVQWAVGLSV